jgi:hypothetical protein
VEGHGGDGLTAGSEGIGWNCERWSMGNGFFSVMCILSFFSLVHLF